MLDIRYVRNNFDHVKEKLAHRGEDLSPLDDFVAYDEKRRKLIAETEQLKAQRNEASKQISVAKREGKDADEAIKQMKVVSDNIKSLITNSMKLKKSYK